MADPGVGAEEIEAIRASDLLLLMSVVEKATGLYNVLERNEDRDNWWSDTAGAWTELGDSLRALGLMEVTDADAG